MVRVRFARTAYASRLEQHKPDHHGWPESLLIYRTTFREYKKNKLLGSTQHAVIAHYGIFIGSRFV